MFDDCAAEKDGSQYNNTNTIQSELNFLAQFHILKRKIQFSVLVVILV